MNRTIRKPLLIGLLLTACAINVHYYWEEIWTIWAKQYLKNQDIVISLTTTPHRIRELEFPLQCLSRQNIPIRQIFVNVPHVFKRDNLGYEIPEWLEVWPNVTILRTEDYGPATKILGTLKNAPLNDDTIIIAVDDDTCYPRNLALRLAVRAKMHPDHAVGVSGATLDFEKNKQGGIVKIMRDHVSVPILEGFAGIAYRRTFFTDSVYEIANEPSFCSNSDDLYLSFHLARNNIARETVNNKYLKTYDILQQAFGYKEDALYKLGGLQSDRYKKCITYLTEKYPNVVFNLNNNL